MVNKFLGSFKKVLKQVLASSAMARRFDRDKDDVLSEQDLKQLRENLSRFRPQRVRDSNELPRRFTCPVS